MTQAEAVAAIGRPLSAAELAAFDPLADDLAVKKYLVAALRNVLRDRLRGLAKMTAEPEAVAVQPEPTIHDAVVPMLLTNVLAEYVAWGNAQSKGEGTATASPWMSFGRHRPQASARARWCGRPSQGCKARPSPLLSGPVERCGPGPGSASTSLCWTCAAHPATSETVCPMCSGSSTTCTRFDSGLSARRTRPVLPFRLECPHDHPTHRSGCAASHCA